MTNRKISKYLQTLLRTFLLGIKKAVSTTYVSYNWYEMWGVLRTKPHRNSPKIEWLLQPYKFEEAIWYCASDVEGALLKQGYPAVSWNAPQVPDSLFLERKRTRGDEALQRSTHETGRLLQPVYRPAQPLDEGPIYRTLEHQAYIKKVEVRRLNPLGTIPREGYECSVHAFVEVTRRVYVRPLR